MSRRLTAATMMLFTGSVAQGHEGHGHPEYTDGLLHYVVNPSHSVAGLYVAAVAIAAIYIVRRQLRKRAQKSLENSSSGRH